jgi:hypothetical protein
MKGSKPAKKIKDLPSKASGKVNGGGINLGNDNMTLLRNASAQ